MIVGLLTDATNNLAGLWVYVEFGVAMAAYPRHVRLTVAPLKLQKSPILFVQPPRAVDVEESNVKAPVISPHVAAVLVNLATCLVKYGPPAVIVSQKSLPSVTVTNSPPPDGVSCTESVETCTELLQEQKPVMYTFEAENRAQL